MQLFRMLLRLGSKAGTEAADAAVAWRLHRTPQAVKTRRRQIARLLSGPVRGPRDKVLVRRIVALRDAGKPFSHIGRELGISKNTAVGAYHDHLQRSRRSRDSSLNGGAAPPHAGR